MAYLCLAIDSETTRDHSWCILGSISCHSAELRRFEISTCFSTFCDWRLLRIFTEDISTQDSLSDSSRLRTASAQLPVYSIAVPVPVLSGHNHWVHYLQSWDKWLRLRTLAPRAPPAVGVRRKFIRYVIQQKQTQSSNSSNVAVIVVVVVVVGIVVVKVI